MRRILRPLRVLRRVLHQTLRRPGRLHCREGIRSCRVVGEGAEHRSGLPVIHSARLRQMDLIDKPHQRGVGQILPSVRMLLRVPDTIRLELHIVRKTGDRRLLLRRIFRHHGGEHIPRLHVTAQIIRFKLLHLLRASCLRKALLQIVRRKGGKHPGQDAV